MLALFDTLPIEARTGLTLFFGFAFAAPLSIWLGWITGKALSGPVEDLSRFAESTLEDRIMNKERA